jgi:ankyrin repeat protein
MYLTPVSSHLATDSTISWTSYAIREAILKIADCAAAIFQVTFFTGMKNIFHVSKEAVVKASAFVFNPCLDLLAFVDATLRRLIFGKDLGLQIAASLGLVRSAKILLRQGADPNAFCGRENSALHLATFAGHKEMATILMEHGANVNLESKQGFTPLHLAILLEKPDMVHLLLENENIDINQQDSNGKSPLVNAILKKQHESMALLLRNEKIIVHDNKKDKNPVQLAVLLRDKKALELLIQSGKLILNSPNNAALHYAAGIGNEEIVDLLIEAGAHVGAVNDNGFTPAMKAYEWNHKELGDKLKAKETHSQTETWSAHKMLSHRFSLDMDFQLTNRTINLNGFYSSHTYANLLSSIQQLQPAWQAVSPKGWQTEDSSQVIQAIQESLELIQTATPENIDSKIDDILLRRQQENIIVIPTGYQGHGNVILLYKDYLIKGDRSGKMGLDLYQIGDQSSSALRDTLRKLILNAQKAENQTLIETEINQVLSLKQLQLLNRSPQHGKTCTWSSSAKVAFQGTLFLQALKKYDALKRHYPVDVPTVDSFKEAWFWIKSMYQRWSTLDCIQAVQDYIDKTPAHPLKKNVLACLYQHLMHKENSKTKGKRFKKIKEDKQKFINQLKQAASIEDKNLSLMLETINYYIYDTYCQANAIPNRSLTYRQERKREICKMIRTQVPEVLDVLDHIQVKTEKSHPRVQEYHLKFDYPLNK